MFAYILSVPAELVLSSTDTETSINRNGLVLNVGSKTFEENAALIT